MSTAELVAELARLAERPWTLAEGEAAPPRGALPALFRAGDAAPRPEQEELAVQLAARLPDLPLVGPTLEWVAARGLEEAFRRGLSAAAGQAQPWCALLQVRALLELAGDGPALLALLRLLLSGAGDATDLALQLDPERFARACLEVLRARLGCGAARRDRTSAELARGALSTLMAVAPDDPLVVSEAGRVLAAEARRAAQRDDAGLALAALDSLGQAPPLPRLRLLSELLPQLRALKRRKLIEQAEALRAAAAEELGAGEELVAELTARTGGLSGDGVARLVLDADREARLSLSPEGAVAVSAPAGLDPEDTRAVQAAVRELEEARATLARRLELALVALRRWPAGLWRAVFMRHPLWRDLAGRLTWVCEPPQGPPQPFDLRPEPLDLFGEPVALTGQVRLLHPLELDADALELWRLRASERGQAAPFPQLFRRVLPAGEAPFARFVGREVHKEQVGELARRSGWSGYPLLGSAPWELVRQDGSARATLPLEDVPLEARRTAFGTKVKEARARRPGEEAPQLRDAAPRVRLGQLRFEPGQLEPLGLRVLLAELVKDLEELSDPLAAPSELTLRTWQQGRWKDPAAAWRELVLHYRQGSPAALAVRRALVQRALEAEGLQVRLEDRFAITRRHVVELGTGLVHEGPDKDHLPEWKVEDRVQEGLEGGALPPWPFAAASDPESVRVVARVVGLLLWERAQAAASAD